MEIKVAYDQVQFDATVEFIATHNRAFIGRQEDIRKAILSLIDQVVDRFPNVTWMGTMGFYVWISSEEVEGIDSDDNSLRIDFMVDPNVGNLYDNNLVEKTYYKKLA